MSSSYLVTGGAGFIGSNLVHHLLACDPEARVTVIDRLTYAGNLDNLEPVKDDPRFRFVHGDICDGALVKKLYEESHGVRYTDEALRAAAELSAKHIHDRFLPDKAIDVIDEVGAMVKLMPTEERPAEIGVREIEQVVARMA